MGVQKERVLQTKNPEGNNSVGIVGEIEAFEEQLEEEKKAEKKRLEGKLEEGQKAHKEDMKELRKEQKKSQREAKQSHRRAEKEHKRHVREERREMQQQQIAIEESLRQMETRPRWFKVLYMVTAFWLLLAISLAGNVIAEASKVPRARVNFALFSIIWAWIALFVGVASCFLILIPMIAVLFWDILATIFIFSAAVALTHKSGLKSCLKDVCAEILSIFQDKHELTS